jgi:hypothetical protein
MVRFNIMERAHTAETRAVSRRLFFDQRRVEPQSAINLAPILH